MLSSGIDAIKWNIFRFEVISHKTYSLPSTRIFPLEENNHLKVLGYNSESRLSARPQEEPLWQHVHHFWRFQELSNHAFKHEHHKWSS